MDQTKLNLGLVTTASVRWPHELPRKRNAEYRAWFEQNYPEINLIWQESIVANDQDVKDVAHRLKKEEADLVVLVLGAFNGDDTATYLGYELKIPIIIWAPTLPPFDGGRLMANSLVAATMNSAALHRLGLPYHFIYGNPDDSRVIRQISQIVRVYGVIKRLRHTFLGLLGYRPTAFYSSTFDETLIRQKFGIRMEEFDLKVLFDKMAEMDQAEVNLDMQRISGEIGLVELPEGHLENHSRLYLALGELIRKQGMDAVSIKCWPEMGQLHTTPCAVLSRLADDGVVIGCENDVDATITMLIQNYLAGSEVFMCDLININEEANSALFWHCGQAACKLKDPSSEMKMANHPLAGQGAVLETTLKPGKVTVARMSKIGQEYKLFLVTGQAVPTKKVVKGVMVDVVLTEPVRDIIYQIAAEGVPHHFSIVWQDVADEMKLMAKILGISVIEIEQRRA